MTSWKQAQPLTPILSKTIFIMLVSLLLIGQASAEIVTINGSGGDVTWSSYTQDNVTEDLGSHGVKVGFFADNFDDNTEDWTESGGTWSVSSGSYKQTDSAATGVYSLANSINISNFVLQSRIKSTAEGSETANGIGLLGRIVDVNNDYYLYFYDVADTINTDIDIAGVQIPLNSTGATAPTPTTDYNYKGYFYGTAIKFKFWQVGTTEPGWMSEATNSTHSTGKFGVTNHRNAVEVDDVTVRSLDGTGNIVTTGNLTAWYNAGSGNVTHQIIVNATTPANTNYSVLYRQNATGDYVSLASAQTGNTTHAITTKYQNTDVRIVLNGNETATPELISLTYYSQASAVYAPNITSWSNTNTSNSSLVFTIIKGQYITFNATANQSVAWTWNKVIP